MNLSICLHWLVSHLSRLNCIADPYRLCPVPPPADDTQRLIWNLSFAAVSPILALTVLSTVYMFACFVCRRGFPSISEWHIPLLLLLLLRTLFIFYNCPSFHCTLEIDWAAGKLETLNSPHFNRKYFSLLKLNSPPNIIYMYNHSMLVDC